MVEIVASLERWGVLSRAPNPEGGRAMPAELTREGYAKVLAVHLAPRRLLEECLTTIDPELGGPGGTKHIVFS
jgi:DNA-binding MarR family transcriptional regulator